MKNNFSGLWMILCCLLPLLAIFLLPGFGVRSNGSILFFVLAMFACHFLMMGGHGGHGKDESADDNKEGNDQKKGEHHGCH